MARLANDEGLYRVVVDSPTRRNYPIRIGRVKSSMANAFRTRVTELEDAVRLGLTPKPNIVEWLDGLSDELHEKLVKARLTSSRVKLALHAWLEQHVAGKVGMKDRSKAKLRETHSKLYAFDRFGRDVSIDRITVADAEDWLVWLHTLKLSNATIRTHCGNAKAIFSRAVKRKLIGENPFAELPSGPTAGDDGPYVAELEASAIIAQLPDTRFRLLFDLARYAGLRVPSETRPLQTTDADMANGMLRVPCEKTSGHAGKQERFVPICHRLRPLLIARFADMPVNGDICPIGSAVQIGGYARRVVMAAIAAAGVAPYTDIFQSLRSSLAKEWKSLGIPEFAVDAWLGHNNVTSRKHYTSNVPPQMFSLITGIQQAAQNPAQTLAEVGGSTGKHSVGPNTEPAGTPRFTEAFQQVPFLSVSGQVEAAGIESARETKIGLGGVENGGERRIVGAVVGACMGFMRTKIRSSNHYSSNAPDSWSVSV